MNSGLIRVSSVAVLRDAVAAGVDHIDTSDCYGPHVTTLMAGLKAARHRA